MSRKYAQNGLYMVFKEQILSAKKQQKQGLNQWIENFNQ